jgi:hypothetical protein
MKFYRYFFLLVAVALFSCSEEIHPNITFLDAAVDGSTHLFNTFNVETRMQNEGDDTFKLVTVTASVENNPYMLIAFTARQYMTGDDACWYFGYLDTTGTYERFDNSMSFHVEESTTHRIRGIFSGQLKDSATGQTVNITGGTFDVFYYN